MDIRQVPSGNFSARRGGVTPDLVVLHYTAMATCGAALERLCNPEFGVSAHYLISEQGDIFQLVDEEMRAWHAGAGSWGSCHDVNSRSVGIELANDGCSPFGARQMDVLHDLLGAVMTRWAIRPERVLGHSDMAPARKSDPGGRFDWRRLALLGQGVWPETGAECAPDEAQFRQLSRVFGYPDLDDFSTLLTAVRLRFRPWASGALEAADMGVIGSLAARFPVDQPPRRA